MLIKFFAWMRIIMVLMAIAPSTLFPPSIFGKADIRDSPKPVYSNFFYRSAGHFARENADIRWLHRAARALRGGIGMQPSDDVESLLAISRQDAVNRLSQHPRFADTVAAYFMYFKGVTFQIRDHRGLLNPRFVEFPDVLAAVQSVMHGNGSVQPLFHGQYRPQIGNFFRSYPDLSLSQTVELNNQDFKAVFDHWISESPTLDRNRFCGLFSYTWGNLSQKIGFPDFFDFRLSFGWLWPLSNYCLFGGELQNLPETVQQTVNRLRDGILPLANEKNHIATPLNSFLDFEPLDLEYLNWSGNFARHQVFEHPSYFFKNYKNTSTNYNRGRAAQILKTYFCDELMPVGIDLDDSVSHAGPQSGHAQDPQCMSCHYKLDPMAGFFRNHGVDGIIYSGEDIVFDDAIAKDRTEYLKAWLNQDPTVPRQWNIGYIRSPTRLELNSYGSELEDLWTIIQKSPETKRCMVQRAFEFFNGAEQIADPAYLDDLADKLTFDPPGNNQIGVSDLIRKIVAGDTFSQENPNPDVCYDRSLQNPGSNLPCAIAQDLKNNCTGCHRNGANPDFTSYQSNSNGESVFKHLDFNGQQYTQSASAAIVIERLTSSDPQLRMPMGRHLDDSTRARMVKWFQKEAQE